MDNLSLIKPLLKFDSNDDFYFLQIIQRKKENPHIGSNSIPIKDYFIRSVEELEERYEEIKTLCNTFNARAMIRLDRRSFKKIGQQTLLAISIKVVNENWNSMKKCYSSCCGLFSSNKDNTWLIDCDNNYINAFILEEFIDNIEPRTKRVITMIPSKTGFHLITKPFDTRQFTQYITQGCEIKKNSPTNLYIP